MRHLISHILLFVSLFTYSQDTIYKHYGATLVVNHNYKDTSVSFGKKIDKILMTEVRSKNKIKKMVVKSFGVDFDTARVRESRYLYKKQGIDIIPNYYKELDFMEIHLSTQNSKELINSYPVNKLTGYEVVSLLGKPYQIFTGDCGPDCLLYIKGKIKLYFYFNYHESCDCYRKNPCDLRVETIEIFYNKKGAEL